jgi:hypothetical protein
VPVHEITPPTKEMLAADEEDKSKKDECKCCMCRKKREEEEVKEVWLVESVNLYMCCVERGADWVAGGMQGGLSTSALYKGTGWAAILSHKARGRMSRQTDWTPST